MKQKRLMGLALASMLVLSGCSSTTKDKGKDVVASINGQNILADDVYKNLSESLLGKNALFSYVLDELIKANFPVTSDMKENADELVNNIETNYKNSYGDEADTKLEEALAASHYEDMDAYRESLIQSLQYSEFIKKYVKANFDEVFEDYYKQVSPRYISLIKVSMADPANPTDEEKEKLEEVKSLLKTDKNFADIASEYSDDDTKTAKGNLGIVDSKSDLSSTYGNEVQTAALSLKQGNVSDPIKGTDGYYFLYCSSQDKEAIKKELKTIDVDSPLLVYDDYMVYLVFNTYELKYDDENIEKAIKEIVKESLDKRNELRGGKS
ncbi:MAG: peptidylprolyl isomerase [Longibaculum sp.]